MTVFDADERFRLALHVSLPFDGEPGGFICRWERRYRIIRRLSLFQGRQNVPSHRLPNGPLPLIGNRNSCWFHLQVFNKSSGTFSNHTCWKRKCLYAYIGGKISLFTLITISDFAVMYNALCKENLWRTYHSHVGSSVGLVYRTLLFVELYLSTTFANCVNVSTSVRRKRCDRMSHQYSIWKL